MLSDICNSKINSGRFQKGHKQVGGFKKGHKLSEESLEKMRKSRKGQPCRNAGALSNLWKGGITPIMKLIRTSTAYILWRSLVFKRDNYTCVWCGARSGNGKAMVLNADHIKAFAVILREHSITNMAEAESCGELWDIDNGRTLCRPCHQTTDTWGRPKKGTYWTTEEQRAEIDGEILKREKGVV